MSGLSRRVLLVGGSGNLGLACFRAFQGTSGWTPIVLDVTKPPPRLLAPLTQEQLVLVDKMEAPHFQANAAQKQLDTVLGMDKLDAVVCVAGGWAGGNAASDSFLSSTTRMFRTSAFSSFLAAHLASKYLHRKGLLVLTGAAPAVGPTPSMMAYGAAKCAVHHLASSLIASSSDTDSGLPLGTRVLTLCPEVLDTEVNREGMPNADRSTWTPLEVMAKEIVSWCESRKACPKHGSFVHITTRDGETTFKPYTLDGLTRAVMGAAPAADESTSS